jgi:hypothetical protein
MKFVNISDTDKRSVINLTSRLQNALYCDTSYVSSSVTMQSHNIFAMLLKIHKATFYNI